VSMDGCSYVDPTLSLSSFPPFFPPSLLSRTCTSGVLSGAPSPIHPPTSGLANSIITPHRHCTGSSQAFRRPRPQKEVESTMGAHRSLKEKGRETRENRACCL